MDFEELKARWQEQVSRGHGYPPMILAHGSEFVRDVDYADELRRVNAQFEAREASQRASLDQIRARTDELRVRMERLPEPLPEGHWWDFKDLVDRIWDIICGRGKPIPDPDPDSPNVKYAGEQGAQRYLDEIRASMKANQELLKKHD